VNQALTINHPTNNPEHDLTALDLCEIEGRSTELPMEHFQRIIDKYFETFYICRP